MTMEIDQLAVSRDRNGNPIFAEYRIAELTHNDLGGWLLAIDDGRYVVCGTEDAVNIYGRDRDDLMERNRCATWAEPARNESMEARIKELQAALSTAEADRKALMEALKPFADVSRENSGHGRGIVIGVDDTEVRWEDFHAAAKVMDRLRSEAEGKGT